MRFCETRRPHGAEALVHSLDSFVGLDVQINIRGNRESRGLQRTGVVKPYFQMGDVTIYHGNARHVLPQLDQSFAAVLTDPPYGIKACDRSDGGVGSIVSGSKFYGRKKWDHKRAHPDVIRHLLGLDVPTVIWGGNYYRLPPTSCLLIWDKKQREFTFADAEVAWTNLKKAVRVYSYGRGKLVREGKVHPTQKPVPLMTWCLGFLPQGVILDPYLGSGSTAVGCVLTGRGCVGIDVDEECCEHAARRCEREIKRPRLISPRQLHKVSGNGFGL